MNVSYFATHNILYALALASFVVGLLLLYKQRKKAHGLQRTAFTIIGMLMMTGSVVLASQGFLAKIFQS